MIVEQGKCLVCGAKLTSSSARCSACETLHHPDCARYMGELCAIYGCTGRTSVMSILPRPVTPLPPPTRPIPPRPPGDHMIKALVIMALLVICAGICYHAIVEIWGSICTEWSMCHRR
ncbi:MAG: hypothetical protein Q7S19_01010 [bacterium]|nr:hypothetical protein [bacterium]